MVFSDRSNVPTSESKSLVPPSMGFGFGIQNENILLEITTVTENLRAVELASS